MRVSTPRRARAAVLARLAGGSSSVPGCTFVGGASVCRRGRVDDLADRRTPVPAPAASYPARPPDSLISPTSPLRTLALPFPYELAIGANGRIHISASSVARVICVRRFLEALEAGRVGGRASGEGKGVKREEGEGEGKGEEKGEGEGGELQQQDVDAWVKAYGGVLV